MAVPRIVGMIPARYASTRLPGKPLAMIAGKPMIQWVCERSAQAPELDAVCVATDDERVAEAVESFGGKALMTREDHASGTDRLAEAALGLEADIIVNIQGDQPFIDPIMITECTRPFLNDAGLNICTLMHPVTRHADLQDPGVVKTAVDLRGFALYFSRSRIPYPHTEAEHRVFEHVGLYAYRRATLIKLAALPQTPLEQVESLEQLRWLEHGYRIRVVTTACADNEFSGFSVDTPEDLQRAESMAKERGLA